MTSTRNKNTSLNYTLETNTYNNRNNHDYYIHASNGRPYTECIPSIGYTPSHISRDALSNNAIDIESSLYGIGSCNLVKPCTPINPEIKNIKFKDYFEKSKEIIMPYPLSFNNNQRPFPV